MFNHLTPGPPNPEVNLVGYATGPPDSGHRYYPPVEQRLFSAENKDIWIMTKTHFDAYCHMNCEISGSNCPIVGLCLLMIERQHAAPESTRETSCWYVTQPNGRRSFSGIPPTFFTVICTLGLGRPTQRFDCLEGRLVCGQGPSVPNSTHTHSQVPLRSIDDAQWALFRADNLLTKATPMSELWQVLLSCCQSIPSLIYFQKYIVPIVLAKCENDALF